MSTAETTATAVQTRTKVTASSAGTSCIDCRIAVARARIPVTAMTDGPRPRNMVPAARCSLMLPMSDNALCSSLILAPRPACALQYKVHDISKGGKALDHDTL